MKYKLKPFKTEHLESAAKLFINNYRHARKECPLLPSRIVDESGWIKDNLQTLLKNTGITIWHNNEMLGYMITGIYFKYKGQKTAWIPEYAHSSVSEDKAQLYQHMYMTLGKEWISQKIHLHLICHLVSDRLFKDVLFRLGFGAIVVEQIRDLSLIENIPSAEIVKEKDISKLIDIEAEHRLYYRESPIFILKDTAPQSIEASLEKHIHNSDEIFVYYVDNDPHAYLIVGNINQSEEGFLLRKTNTAQIKSAYAKHEVRGKGIGKLLLNTAIKWANEKNYERLFVEHETANFSGGNFWNKHFTPIVYASMRYIDNGI